MSDDFIAYSGLARLLDATLDDGPRGETTTDAFLEDALRRFGKVRTELNNSGPEPLSGVAYINSDEVRAPSEFKPRTDNGTAIGSPLHIDRRSGVQSSIYTLRHDELEQQYFEVIEAVRSNGHTTPDYKSGHGLLKMIVAQAHSSSVFTAEAAAYTELAKNRRHAGHFADAERYVRTALRISEEREFRRSTTLAYIELGMLLSDEAYLSCADNLIEPTDLDLRARVSYAYARCARLQGDLVRALELLVKSEMMYEAAGDAFGLARAKARLGSYLRLLGDFQAATHHLEEALLLAQRGGFKRIEGYVLLDIGDILRVTGHDSNAGALLRSAKQLFSEMGHIGGKARALIGLALLETRHGNSTAGVAYAEEACSLSENIDRVMDLGPSASTALALRCLGACLADMDVIDEPEAGKVARFERANTYLDRAINAYRTLGNRDGEALSLVVKAKLLARSATPDAALPLAIQALGILSELPGRFWQGTDTTRTDGSHSWCYMDIVAIAVDCDDYHIAQKALLSGEQDRSLRELRSLLVRQGGKLGETVHKLALVELMMYLPAHEPDLGVMSPHCPKPGHVELRNALLQKIETLDPDVASRLRNK